MSWYEKNVDRVVGIVPDQKYHAFGMEDSPELSTRGFAKSVLMPGHMLADIYEGDIEAVLYAEQALSTTAGLMFIQYGITGKVSERALYGVAKGFKRAPTVIIGFEFFYAMQDLASMSEDRYMKEPKSATFRGLHGGGRWAIDKIWPGLGELKYGQDQ